MEEQKFLIGEIVYEIARPGQKLVITKANGNCTIVNSKMT